MWDKKFRNLVYMTGGGEFYRKTSKILIAPVPRLFPFFYDHDINYDINSF